MIPPLCIIQARYHSRRLPGKMLLPLHGETLIARGWRIACDVFGSMNCVVTVPFADADGPLGEELERIGARRMWWSGDEWDVLSRFHATAHSYRWHPDSVIVRYTPDDPWKDVDALRHVAEGARHCVEFGGEAFTLAQLDHAHRNVNDPEKREHITHALFDYDAPQIAAQWFYEKNCSVVTIDTQADYDAACAAVMP